MESHDGVHLTMSESSNSISAPAYTVTNEVTEELVEVNLSKILKLVNQQTLKGYKAGYDDGFKEGYDDATKTNTYVSFLNGISVGMILSGVYLYLRSHN